MKMFKLFFISILLSAILNADVHAQKNDTLIVGKDSINAKKITTDSISKKDSLILKKKSRDPGKASLYSAILPGLGQVYNRKYWKLPLVYAAVGIPIYEFFDNRKWFNKTRYALAVVANGSYTNLDSLNQVDPKLLPFVQALDATDLVKYRNQFRQWEDYSVLFFLFFYALQIVDATVDAHLKDFNVSSDLSLELKPNAYSTSNFGISFVFDIHKAKPKPLFDIR